MSWLRVVSLRKERPMMALAHRGLCRLPALLLPISVLCLNVSCGAGADSARGYVYSLAGSWSGTWSRPASAAQGSATMLVVVDTSAQTATFTLNAVGDVFGAAADSLTNVVFEGIVTREDFTANRNDNPCARSRSSPPLTVRLLRE
jgi:hypothetical protein